jgi:hypothetical protein
VESPWGEVSQRATWHNGQSQTRGPEGKEPPTEMARGEALQHVMWKVGQTSMQGVTPLGEAHGRPPDLPDPYPRGSAALEHIIVDPKACARIYEVWRPVPDKCTCACPELWPGAGGENEDLDTCTRASVLLKGEQNMILPSVRSEQYAAPYTPLPVDPLPPETFTHEIPRGEGIAPIRRAANERHFEPLNPPDLVIKDLGEAGGVLSALSDAPGVPERLGLVRAAVGMHKPGGVPLAMKAIPAPTEDTAGIKLASTADGAVAVKPKALEPWARGEARHERDAALDKTVTGGTCEANDKAPHGSLTGGERALEVLLLETTTADGHKLELEVPPQRALTERGPHTAL